MAQHISEILGLDVGDRRSRFCVVSNETGEVLSEGTIRSARGEMSRLLEGAPRTRVVLEAGTHSPWISAEIQGAGHEAVVVLPHRVRLITQNHKKSDQVDAELLARLGRLGTRLLATVKHRGEEARAHLATLRSRDQLVRARTSLVLHCRGAVKSTGSRLPSCSTSVFSRRVLPHVPKSLQPAVLPLLEAIETMNTQIARIDGEIERLSEKVYPETKRLRQVPGVGPVTALAFVLTIEDPHRFRRSRDVGAYVGLVPRRDQSGDVDKQLRITKAGDRMLRTLLVQAAHYILGPFGADTAFRRWAEPRLALGAGAMKKRTVVAVARKLAVLLHSLWLSGEAYEPVRGVADAADAADEQRVA